MTKKEVTMKELKRAIREINERIENEFEMDFIDYGISSRSVYVDFRTDDYMKVEAQVNISTGLMNADTAMVVTEMMMRAVRMIKEFKYNGYTLVFE